MKKLFGKIVALIPFLILFGCTLQSTRDKMIADQQGKFTIQCGVNLSHWLSQVPPWMARDTFITKTDIDLIAQLGFDHVRIPIDEEEMWTENGDPIETSFSFLKSCLDWCESNGLKAVVDLHILRSHHFNALNSEGKIYLWTDTIAQLNFIKLWMDISDRIGNYPISKVAYEIMNEPVAEDPDDWNRLLARAVKEIRKKEPLRTLIIGPNRWQTAENFPYLKVPENDTNLILSVHTYDPIIITHYKASWNPLRDYRGPITYPGVPVSDKDLMAYTGKNSETRKFILDSNREYNRNELERILLPAIERSKELGLPLYCGEFGCLPTIPRAMRLQYYRDITDVLQRNNLAYANWDFKGDFAIVDYDRENSVNGEADLELIEILTVNRYR